MNESTISVSSSQQQNVGDTPIVYTLYGGQKSLNGDRLAMSWGELRDSIISEPEISEQKDGLAFIFGDVRPDKDGLRRHKKDLVERVHALAADFDDVDEVVAFEALDRLRAEGYEFLGWPTWSGLAKPKPGLLRFRLVFPLASPIAGKDWPRYWPAAVATLGLAELVDKSCKDASRLSYVTCPPSGAPVWQEWCELLSGHGRALDIPLPSGPAESNAQQEPDLNSVADGSARIARCPAGTSPIDHAHHLCRTMPPAVSGQGGHLATLRLARALVWGLQLPPEQAVKLLIEVYNPRCLPEWSESELMHKCIDASSEDGAAYAKGALLPAPPDSFEHLPLIVQRERRYWLRTPDSDDYACRVKEPDLVRKCKDLYGEQELATWNDSDNPRIGKATVEDKSRVADRVVTCYFVPRTSFDVETNTLTEGLRIDPQLRAEFNEHVERWLSALAGDDLPALKQWIAGCRPELLRAPAPALGIVGPKEAGKSLIAAGLARIWGDPCAPVSAMVLVAQFNADLARCPIVLADEKLPKDMSGEDFREKVAARSHSIEPKGKERQVLNGSIRLVVAANNIDRVVGLTGEKCDDDLQAIADRWRLIEVIADRAAECVQALAPLKGADGSNVNLRALAEHFLWIQANVEPHRGRFVGSAPDAKILARLRRSEASRTLPEVFELVSEFLADPWPMNETVSDPVPRRGEPQHDQRRNWPLLSQGGRLFARYGVVGAIIGETAKAVGVALRPFQVGEREWITVCGTRTRAYELDADRICQVVR